MDTVHVLNIALFVLLWLSSSPVLGVLAGVVIPYNKSPMKSLWFSLFVLVAWNSLMCMSFSFLLEVVLE